MNLAIEKISSHSHKKCLN